MRAIILFGLAVLSPLLNAQGMDDLSSTVRSDTLIKRVYKSGNGALIRSVREQYRRRGDDGIKEAQFRAQLSEKLLELQDTSAQLPVEGTFCPTCQGTNYGGSSGVNGLTELLGVLVMAISRNQSTYAGYQGYGQNPYLMNPSFGMSNNPYWSGSNFSNYGLGSQYGSQYGFNSMYSGMNNMNGQFGYPNYFGSQNYGINGYNNLYSGYMGSNYQSPWSNSSTSGYFNSSPWYTNNTSTSYGSPWGNNSTTSYSSPWSTGYATGLSTTSYQYNGYLGGFGQRLPTSYLAPR